MERKRKTYNHLLGFSALTKYSFTQKCLCAGCTLLFDFDTLCVILDRISNQHTYRYSIDPLYNRGIKIYNLQN